MNKLTLLAAGAIGYVFGTRAGRERYDQIKQQADKVWTNPTVQKTVDDVSTQAKQTASGVGTKVSGAASDAGSRVADKVKRDHTDPASDTYRPDDEHVGPPPVPGGPSGIAEADRNGPA